MAEDGGAVGLVTERLLLRNWQASDAEPFARLNADPEVMEYFPACLSRTESDALAARCADMIATEGWGPWAVEVRATGEFIGFTGLARPSFAAAFLPAVEIGWRLTRSAWGYGYATEAATAAAGFAFDELELPGIVAFTAVGNLRSRAVMDRLGMTHDPGEDFDHPRVPEGHPVRRHALYRLAAGPRS
ncbi:GNAT family N-acetyltransferase [Yinghuangia soli]|uniref:GNAT family N-acetyltransferase n=1 Tax=Yinghuangia soli TaxID=2908204 RepID=A0AA41Q9C4_9ACTN|nr:GNAT family N-acetyltransferase [Yinghuangia soli]MCF2533315.1 GNAT family N-acetyltransferase [Yinghuangia soli]